MRHGRRGAGIVVAARVTGRILILLRSEEVMEPLTWGLPGGKIDAHENARTAAIRELEEETGYDDPITVLKDPIFVFEEPDFEFLTYFGYIEREFEPQLNWESDDGDWFALGSLPSPLHFGVATLMRERKSAIAAEIARIPRWPS